MGTISFKEKLLAGIYYLGPLGMVAFLKKSTDFEKFHAIQGLALFYLFTILVIWGIFSIWVVPLLVGLTIVGFLAVIFWLGFALYSVAKEQKMQLPGLEFLTFPLKQYLVEEI